MNSLDFQMALLDDAFVRYQRTVEESRYWDMIEHLYDRWNADVKSYWAQFSPAYREGSEFYFEDLPTDLFWKMMFCLTAAWYENELLQVD